VPFETVKKLRKSYPQESSGECVQGVKTPCAFNKTDFSNFLSLKNLGSAGQKDFFDTLKWHRISVPFFI